MGSNIYLKWDNQTEEEKEKQISIIFEISAGYVGYLRASLGMVSENSFLKILFSSEYWDAGGKGLRFEFTEEKFKELEKAGFAYLMSAFTGKEIKCSQTEMQAKTNDAILNALKKAGYSKEQIRHSGSLKFRTAVIWLESVFAFFELGMEMEKKGLNPRVLIEW